MTPLALEPRTPPKFRRAFKFFVATEGTLEAWYLEGLERNGHLPDARRIELIVLPPANDESAPSRVVQRLADRTTREPPRPIDQCWGVFDVDRWGANLHGALQDLQAEGWNAAVSNPCFEIWLQAHLTDTPDGDKPAAAKAEWGALRARSSTPDWPFDDAAIDAAVRRCAASDTGDDLPGLARSHVHRLVRELRSMRRPW